MTKLADKWKQNYSLSSLRDVAFTAITNDDYIVYNSASQKFENKKQPRFGRDFSVEKVTGLQNFTGGSFQTYATLNFAVSGPDTVNKFRMNCSFSWGHNSASNDARFRVLVDGVPLPEELRIEPKDPGTDQRIPAEILDYLDNLSIGNHSIALQARPATASRITRIYKAVIEVWRVV